MRELDVSCLTGIVSVMAEELMKRSDRMLQQLHRPVIIGNGNLEEFLSDVRKEAVWLHVRCLDLRDKTGLLKKAVEDDDDDGDDDKEDD